MNKINIKDLTIDIDINELFLNLNSVLIIDVKGNCFFNIDEEMTHPIIYKNTDINIEALSKHSKDEVLKLFKDYKPNIVGSICKIKPLTNWQNIIGLNTSFMLYYDHQSDGVEIFEDKELEDIGWQASALEINYRQIAEFIEENCDGILLCYDNEVQFNGFTYTYDIEDTRKKVFNYIVETTKENLQNSILDLEDEDVIEALEFFDIKAGN